MHFIQAQYVCKRNPSIVDHFVVELDLLLLAKQKKVNCQINPCIFNNLDEVNLLKLQ